MSKFHPVVQFLLPRYLIEPASHKLSRFQPAWMRVKVRNTASTFHSSTPRTHRGVADECLDKPPLTTEAQADSFPEQYTLLGLHCALVWSRNVNQHGKDFQFRLGPAWFSLLTGNGGDEMCLDDVEPGVQHHIKSSLVVSLVGDGLHQLLPGLLVHESPEAVLTILQKRGQRHNNPDASLRWRQIDGGGLLHLLCIRQDRDQRRALVRDAGMRLDPQLFNQRTLNSLRSGSAGRRANILLEQDQAAHTFTSRPEPPLVRIAINQRIRLEWLGRDRGNRRPRNRLPGRSRRCTGNGGGCPSALLYLHSYLR